MLDGVVVQPAIASVTEASAVVSAAVDPGTAAAAVTNRTVVGLTPNQVRHAYGFDQITLSGGITGDGSGQTIAIVDAYDDPNIASDLRVFDTTFGLADPPSFRIYKQTAGGVGPRTDAGWSEEIALDVEWAHAMAPRTNILLVEARTSSLTDLLSAVDYARNQPGVSVVSMSWGASEFSGETFYDSRFTTPNGHQPVTFVASSGDWGAPAIWPAISPNVLSVGGTRLTVSGSSYVAETGWSGSGGGYSRYETEPSWQRGVQTTNLRSNPDVAYDADPRSGFAVYDTVAVNGRTGWFQIGGTSAGAPQWASIVAIADQGRALSGKSTLGNVQSTIYSLAAGDFHDITTGSNGYSARVGYDAVTGRGTPLVNLIVRDLVGGTTSSAATAATPTTTLSFWDWYLAWLRSIGLSESADAPSPTGTGVGQITLLVSDSAHAPQVDQSAMTLGTVGANVLSTGAVRPVNADLAQTPWNTPASVAAEIALHERMAATGDGTSGSLSPDEAARDWELACPDANASQASDSARWLSPAGDKFAPAGAASSRQDAANHASFDALRSETAGEPVGPAAAVDACFGDEGAGLFDERPADFGDDGGGAWIGETSRSAGALVSPLALAAVVHLARDPLSANSAGRRGRTRQLRRRGPAAD